MFFKRICLIAILVFLTLFRFNISMAWGKTGKDNVLKLSIKTLKDEFCLGEPILVNCSIKNESKKSIEIWIQGYAYYGLSINLNKESKFIGYEKEVPIYIDYALTEAEISAGNSYDFNILLNHWIFFKKSGHAVIECRMPVIINTKPNRDKVLYASLELDIVSSNVTNLFRIITNLGNQLNDKSINRKNVMKRLRASDQLEVLAEEITMPLLSKKIIDYLQIALNDQFSSVQMNAINGLGKIESKESTYLLINKALNLSDPGCRDLATKILKKRGIQIKDIKSKKKER